MNLFGYKHLLWLIVFVLFLVEGTLFPWLIPPWVSDMRLSVVPHFTLVGILYIALYLNRNMGVAMGLVFGILHDIIFYGHVLGAYAFGMGIGTYLIALLLRDSHITWYLGIGAIMLGLLLFDVMVYGLYFLFQIADVSPWWIFLHASLPSLLINLIFALILYWPVLKGFARIEKYVAPGESEVFPAGNP